MYHARDRSNVPCNDYPLNFARALIDFRDFGVEVVTFDAVVFEVAIAATGLDRVRTDLVLELKSVELRL